VHTLVTAFEPSGVVPLSPDEVHVYRAGDRDANRWPAGLAQDECARAELFRSPGARRAYVAGRSLLRAVLACHLGIADPIAVPIRTGPHGKPSLDPAIAGGLEFNVSHSGGLVLVAVARRTSVGVDVEGERPYRDLLGVARRYFSRVEVRALETLPPEERAPAFRRCWTRKEAYVKAKGLGLQLSFDSFDVTLHAGGPVRLLETRRDPEDARRFTLHELDPGPGFVAALAVKGCPSRVRCLDPHFS